MKTNLESIAFALAFICGLSSALAQSAAFTYQGRLNDNGTPADGNYDLRFAICDSAGGGSVVAGPVTNTPAGISNGVFTTTLDFGADVFIGADRWLEIAVRTNGAGAFAVLSPRQPITSTPSAVHASSATTSITAGSANAVAAANIVGTIPDAQLGANIPRLAVPNTASPATGVPTVANGFIIGAAVTSGGSGYVTPPAVTVNDATGSGAVITANVSNGAVVSLNVTQAGSGYSPNATLTIEPPPGNAYQVFASTNYFNGVNFLTNLNNVVAGSFVGDGAGLVNLDASALSSGTVGEARIDAAMARDNEIMPTVLAGDGAGSGLDADRLDGLDSAGFAAAAHNHDTAYWKLDGNTGTNPTNNFLGTTDGQPLELKVQGERAFRLEPAASTNENYGFSPNVIGGFSGNTIAPGVIGATIAGGGRSTPTIGDLSHRITAHHGTIGGGDRNTVNGENGTIAGGGGNVVSGSYSFVGSGLFNTISSNTFSATIGGGAGNTIHTNTSGTTIAGGENNVIQAQASRSAIAGGQNNGIGLAASEATIGGGRFNTIQSNAVAATISGGENNVIQAQSEASTIAGGWNNIIGSSAFQATISGGAGNRADGNYATVPGGAGNAAAGAFSFAAGRRAKANHPGAFVWGDSQLADVVSERTNQFRVRANGGVRFDVNATHWISLFTFIDAGFIAKVIDTSTGAYLTTGGSWVNNSDRAAKENVHSINSREVLEAVAALPISTWNYRAESPIARHIGPMAQDFAAAFGLGGDDRHIATVDADGVALAAIQGVNEKLEEQVKEKEARIQSLEKRLAALEQSIADLTAEKSPSLK